MKRSEQRLRDAIARLSPDIAIHFRRGVWFDAEINMLFSADGLYGLAFDQRLNDGTVFVFNVGEGG